MNHEAKNIRRDFSDDNRNNRLEDLELNTGLFGDAEDLVTFAQAYYATEFPRTDALKCPPLEELREVAHSNGLPDEELREHLFICSDCFRSFRSARREAEHQSSTVAWWCRYQPPIAGSAIRHTFIAAGIAGVALLSCLTLVLWRNAKESPQIAAQHSTVASALPPQATAPPIVEAAESVNAGAVRKADKPSSRRTTVVAARRREGVNRKLIPAMSARDEVRTIAINLEEYVLLRGAAQMPEAAPDENAERVITLAPRQQRLSFRLPQGSRAGRYAVSVVDAFGKSLTSAITSSQGRRLVVTLDLRGLEPKSYRLVIARDTEAPDFYILNVNSQ